jgi:hypothetical protein
MKEDMWRPCFLEPLSPFHFNARDSPTTAIDMSTKQVPALPDLVYAKKCPDRAFSLHRFRDLGPFPVSFPLW